jgi:hypothetical protein
METYGGVGIAPPFLTSTLGRGELSASRPGRFNPGEVATDTYWIGSWMGPRTGLEAVEKRKFLPLPGLEHRPSRHSPSLYGLRHPDSQSD